MYPKKTEDTQKKINKKIASLGCYLIQNPNCCNISITVTVNLISNKKIWSRKDTADSDCDVKNREIILAHRNLEKKWVNRIAGHPVWWMNKMSRNYSITNSVAIEVLHPEEKNYGIENLAIKRLYLKQTHIKSIQW